MYSDHRIEQSPPNSFFASEDFPFRPDDPPYDSASLVADQIFATHSSNGCSQNDLLQRTYNWYDEFHGHEGVADWRPLDALDESAPNGHSSTEHFDILEFLDPSLLTAWMHEPQSCFAPNIDQLAGETLAENSQSQISLDPHTYGIQQSSPNSRSSASVASKANDTSAEIHMSPCSLLASDISTPPQSASPPDISQPSIYLPDGKRAIESAPAKFSCPTCTRSFSNALRFSQHVKEHRALSHCEHCGEHFKYAKDRQRHLGSSNAAPSCRILKAAGSETKHFACICKSKAFTRKDTLIRHLRLSTTGEHCCRACGSRPCTCL